MTAFDAILSITVFIGFGIWAYSRFQHQTIKDTIIEIKELFDKIKQQDG